MPFDDMDRPDKYHDFEQRWDWIVTFMVCENKFVHEMLMLLEKSASDAVGTMGISVVDGTLKLIYSPKFVNSLTDAELRFVVTHEIYHVALHHCTTRLPERKEDRGLYNVAADLAINCLIPTDSNISMPKAKKEDVKKGAKKEGQHIGLLPEDYGFPTKLSMEQYITLLKEKGVDCSEAGGESGLDNHDGWSEENSEAVKEIIRQKIEQLKKNERVWGSMPADIQALIEAAQRSTISWRKYLRQRLGNLVSSRIEPTFKKPNRRFGYPYCGTKRMHCDRKLVAIDTSGSIGDNDLSQFLAEINRLAEIQPVDLQLFDADLQGKVVPFDRKRSRFDFKGRGGTDFGPVLKMADERRYQSVIILTDGCASAPDKPRHVKDILWVLTSATDKPPVEWGERVHIVARGEPQPTPAA